MANGLKSLYINGVFRKHITVDELATELGAVNTQGVFSIFLIDEANVANKELIKTLTAHPDRSGQIK